MKLLEVNKLSVSYGEYEILRDVGFFVEEGQWLMITGPNGAGKSTLVNAVSGGVKYSGEILCMGESLRKIKARELARRLGVLAQNHYVAYAFSVEDVVSLGCYSRRGGYFPDGGGERESVEKALKLTGLEGMRKQSVLTLSGGELQRCFLAQLIAQNPKIMILDEPTNHLDLVYQKQLLATVSDWLSEGGRAVISVSHDLSIARACGTHALLLSRGQEPIYGEAAEVLSDENLERAYAMDVRGWMRDMLGQWR